MGSRRTALSNFDASFSRRPTSGTAGASILGDPPGRRQTGQSFGSYGGDRDGHYGGGGGGGGGGNSAYSSGGRREEASRYDYGHGESRNQERQGSGGLAYQNVSFVPQGLRPRESGQTSGSGMRQEMSPWTTSTNRRSPSPIRLSNFNRRPSPQDSRSRNETNTWSTSRGFEESITPFKNPMQSLAMSGLNSLGHTNQQGNQPVVMVVPQAQAGSAGIMGMNPFNVLQRGGGPTPMQVILGNLPAFNSDAFGQQLLTAATNAQLGQMMGVGGGAGAQGRQGQGNQFNRQAFDRDDSDRSRIARQRNSQGVGASSGRRPGNDSMRNLVPRNMRGGNSTSNASDRGRKRGFSDRQTNDGDTKRFRLGQNQTGKSGNRDKGGKTPVSSTKTPQTQRNNKKSSNNSKNAASTSSPTKGNDTKAKAEKTENTEPAKEKEKAEVVEVLDDEEKKDSAEAKEDEVSLSPKKTTEEKPKKKSKYEEIPAELLVCKICQKSMNDSGSFESHLNGRAHQALARILDLRFKKRVDVLMTDSKLNEEEIAIEIERQKRAGKATQGGNKNKNFCKMCDCNYAVNWGTHKLSLGHRVLKQFLHPTCGICETNFVNRLDWVNHLTDAGHLRKILLLKQEGRDMDEECSTSQDQLFSVFLEMTKEEHVPNCVSIRNVNWKIPSREDLKFILDSDMRDLVAPDEVIVVPKNYDATVSYGANAINDVSGFSCKICRSYVTTPKEVEAHCKSQAHFNAYCGFLRKLANHREQVKEEKKKAEEKAAAEAAEKEKKEKAAAEAKEKKKCEEEPATADTSQTDDSAAVDMDENIENVAEDQMEVVDEINGDDPSILEEEDMNGEEEYAGVEDEVGGDGDGEDDVEVLVPSVESSPSKEAQVVENSPKKGRGSASPQRAVTPKGDVAVVPVDVEVSLEKVETKAVEVEEPPPAEAEKASTASAVATPSVTKATPAAGTGKARCSGRGAATPARGQNNASNRQPQGARGRARGVVRGTPGGAGRRGGGGFERARGRGRGFQR